MRIAVLSHHQSGAGTPLASLWFSADECRKRGILFDFIWTKTERLDGLDVLRRADRVIFDGIYALQQGWGQAYYFMARLLRKPVGVYYHETDWNLKRATHPKISRLSTALRPLATWHAMHNRGVVHFHVCDTGLQSLIRDYNISLSKTRLLENITNAQAFLTPTLPLPSETAQCVVSGKASERKGTDLFLEVAHRVCSRNPRWTFRWIGGFAAKGSFSKEALAAKVRKLGLEENVFFLGHHTDVVPLTASAEIVLSVSRDDPMPKVLMEALALGKHCIAPDVGGIRDLLGEHGTIVAAGDIDGFAAAILRGSPDTSEAAQAARRDYFVSRFTEKAFAERFEAALTWWIGESRLGLITQYRHGRQ